MTVRSVTKKWSDDTSDTSWDGRTATDSYQVDCDSRFEAETANDGTTAIPGVGLAHTVKPSMEVENKSVSRVGFSLYEVAVNYSIPENGTFEPESNAEDPLSKPAVESWETGLLTEQFDRDVHGNVVTNTAGSVLEQPITRTITTLILNIKVNQPTPFNPAVALGFLNKTNNVTFKSVNVGQAKCIRFAPSSQNIDASASYYELHIRVEFREDGFDGRAQSRGRTMLVGGVATDILERDLPGALVADADREKGSKVSTPKLLDSNGALTDEAFYVEFDNYFTADLTKMPGV